MNIVHITTENPFRAHGGLSTYVRDIINEQKDKNNILVVFPGHSKLMKRKLTLKTYSFEGVELIEVINPVPATFLEGTRFPEFEIDNPILNEQLLKKFTSVNTDLVHFHTFIGFNCTLVKLLSQKKIKTCYTAHDYQPLCNKITLLDFNGEICTDIQHGKKCSQCNRNALSKRAFAIRNSVLGNYLKSIDPIKGVVKAVMSRLYSKKTVDNIDFSKAEAYQNRRNQFVKIFNEHMNMLIVSSSLTHSYFQKLGIFTPSQKILMANRSLTDSTDYSKQNLNRDRKKIGYIGGLRIEKGYSFLKDALIQYARDKKENIELIIAGPGSKNIVIENENIKVTNVGFCEQNKLFEMFDILIVPSIWPETYGLVLPEALKRGKIVIASANVGSALELKSDRLYIYSDENDFYKKIETAMSVSMDSKVMTEEITELWPKHVDVLNKIYDKLNEGL